MSYLDQRGRRALEHLAPNPEELCSGATASEHERTHIAALTGTQIGTLSMASAATIPEVFEHARAIQSCWARTSIPERRDLMLAFHDLVLTERHHLLDLIQWETGKSRGSAFEEVSDVAINARYYARSAERALKDRKVAGAVPLLTKTIVRYQPKGVVAAISPWNYPFTLTASDSLAAMMAGNAVVIKPDSQTPYIALAVKSLFERAGFPTDLFQVVLGSGSELGDPMIESADYVMFTGSTATGRSIAERAGKNLIGFSAELGGKNPMIIRADALAAKAAAGAVKASFSNSGQLCISIERIYVHTKIWDEFVPAFVRQVEKLKVAASMNWDDDMGPLINESQFQKVSEHVQDAVDKGATVLTGGKPLPHVGPNAYAPTVLTGVTPEMDVFAEETFGPVVSLYEVDSDDDAVRLANDTSYGLNSAIWTGNFAAAEELAQRVKTGMVNINDGYAAAWASIGAPSGGVKASGMSHRHGPEGIIKYTDIHVTASQRLMPVAAPPVLGEKGWARLLTGFLKTQRRLPPQLFREK